eukprot:GHVU01011421.1.p1 GENE.GHVU01011421.1~~GHVU01011421.1.p1  ORF type:complete len:220 (+),score=14.82 GHVU01011421.1:86-745(+)
MTTAAEHQQLGVHEGEYVLLEDLAGAVNLFYVTKNGCVGMRVRVRMSPCVRIHVGASTCVPKCVCVPRDCQLPFLNIAWKRMEEGSLTNDADNGEEEPTRFRLVPFLNLSRCIRHICSFYSGGLMGVLPSPVKVVDAFRCLLRTIGQPHHCESSLFIFGVSPHILLLPPRCLLPIPSMCACYCACLRLSPKIGSGREGVDSRKGGVGRGPWQYIPARGR